MDAHTLLCERCGYPIENLDRAGPCPECGRPVRDSLPAHRSGTAWQQRPSIRRWFATNYRSLRHPRLQFESMKTAGPTWGRGWSLALTNLTLAAFLIVDPFVGTLIGDPFRSARGKAISTQAGTYLVSLVGGVTAVVGILLLLMWLEMLGVRFIARRRGWRLTKAAAWNVCCHASIGWVFSGLLPVLVLATGFALLFNFGIVPQGTIRIPGPNPISINVQDLFSIGGSLLGYFLGMLIFESLVYAGIQSCRYAADEPRAAPTDVQAGRRDGAGVERP